MSNGPLLSNIYIADPSAHVFNDRIYVYPSHDRETDIVFNDRGDQYDMVDYHVVSMDRVGAKVIDHGVGLRVEDVKWASKQLWAPDAFQGKDGRFYLCFPARDKKGEHAKASHRAALADVQVSSGWVSQWAINQKGLSQPTNPTSPIASR